MMSIIEIIAIVGLTCNIILTALACLRACQSYKILKNLPRTE